MIVVPATVSVIASGIITMECVDGDSVVVVDVFRWSSISNVVSKRVAGRRVIVLFGMKFHVVRAIGSVDASPVSLITVVVGNSSLGMGDAVISFSPRRGSLPSIVITVVTSPSISVARSVGILVGPSVPFADCVVVGVCLDVVDCISAVVVVAIVDASVVVNGLVGLDVIGVLVVILVRFLSVSIFTQSENFHVYTNGV